MKVALLARVAWLAGALLAAGAQAGTRHAVTIEGMRYNPETVEVQPGDVIAWTNLDPFPHTVTFNAPLPDSREIPANGTWSMPAPVKGSYSYRCALHPVMHGALIAK